MKRIFTLLLVAFLVMGVEAAQPVKKASQNRKTSTTKTASSTSKSKGTSKKAKNHIRVEYTSVELKQNYIDETNRPLLACFYDCKITGLKNSTIKNSLMIFKEDPEEDLSTCEKNRISYATLVKNDEAYVDAMIAELGFWGLFAVSDNVARLCKLKDGNDAIHSIEFTVDSDPCYFKNYWMGLYNHALNLSKGDSYYAVMVSTYDRSKTEKDIIIGHSKVMKFTKQ